MIVVHAAPDAAQPPVPTTFPAARADVAHVEVPWGRLDASTIAQPTPGVRIHVTVDVPGNPTEGWPDGAQVTALLAAGVTKVRLRHAGTVSPAGSTHLVAFLAESISLGLPITWDLDTPPHTDTARTDSAGTETAGTETAGTEQWPFAAEVGDLVHLPPPDGLGHRALAWQDRHAYGLMYWRHGGTFAAVTDMRGLDQARYTIDDPELLTLFTSSHQAVQLSTLEAAAREQVGVLEEARLVYTNGDWAARLPFRLLRWPMPLDLIG